jgi:hypothetical protein
VTSTLLAALCVSLAGCLPDDGADRAYGWAAALAPARLANTIAYCLQERGWKAEVDPIDGGLTATIPEDQTERYDADFAACDPSSASDYFFTLTAAQVRALYRQRLAVYDCLGDHGFARVDPPELSEFARSDGNWVAFDLSASYTQTDIQALRSCSAGG